MAGPLSGKSFPLCHRLGLRASYHAQSGADASAKDVSVASCWRMAGSGAVRRAPA